MARYHVTGRTVIKVEVMWDAFVEADSRDDAMIKAQELPNDVWEARPLYDPEEIAGEISDTASGDIDDLWAVEVEV